MSAAANKATAQAFLTAIEQRRWDDVATYVTADLVSWIPRSCEAVLGYPTVVRGADAVLEARRASGDARYTPKMTFRTDRILGDGDLVSAFVNVRTDTAEGAPYENDYVMLFRFEGGKIAEWGEYLDTGHAYTQFGLRIVKPGEQ